MPDENAFESDQVLQKPIAPLSAKKHQEEAAKQWGYLAGSLTFVLLMFPQFFSGIPSPEAVGFSLLGTGVLYVLGYQAGYIWHSPLRELKTKAPPEEKEKKESPTKAPLPQLESIDAISGKETLESDEVSTAS